MKSNKRDIVFSPGWISTNAKTSAWKVSEHKRQWQVAITIHWLHQLKYSYQIKCLVKMWNEGGCFGLLHLCSLSGYTCFRWLNHPQSKDMHTALGSPFRVPKKIALMGFRFNKASIPDLKSSRIISISKWYLPPRTPIFCLKNLKYLLSTSQEPKRIWTLLRQKETCQRRER